MPYSRRLVELASSREPNSRHATNLELDHERISSKVIDIDDYGADLDGSGSISLSGTDELGLSGHG